MASIVREITVCKTSLDDIDKVLHGKHILSINKASDANILPNPHKSLDHAANLKSEIRKDLKPIYRPLFIVFREELVVLRKH